MKLTEKLLTLVADLPPNVKLVFSSWEDGGVQCFIRIGDHETGCGGRIFREDIPLPEIRKQFINYGVKGAVSSAHRYKTLDRISALKKQIKELETNLTKPVNTD